MTTEKPKKTRSIVPLADRIMKIEKLQPLIAAASDADKLALVERAQSVVDAVRDSLAETPAAKLLREKFAKPS